MKNKIFSLTIGTIVALASCSKSEEASTLPQSGEQTATFNIAAPETRALVTNLTRYIVEAYEGEDLTTTPTRVEATTGSLTLALKKDTEYTFVFWADKGTANTAIAISNDYYDATTLQDVKVNPSAYATVATPAYCLAVQFNSNDLETSKAVVLKNATAQLHFTEAAGLLTADNSLTVKYSSGGKLNVATGKITEIGSEISRTYNNIGKIAKDDIVVTDYILAPLGEKRLLDLKVTFNAEAEKAITAVPFQQSYITNVKGEYSNLYESVFTISNKVADYDNDEVVFPQPKIGDFYYSDNTFSSTIESEKTCIGIVFWVDPTDATKGKIVSLDEIQEVWGYQPFLFEAYSTTDGAVNTAEVTTSIFYSQQDFPAFAWCITKNATVPAGINWYLPAKEELKALYGKYADGTDTNIDASVMAAVNASLKNVSGGTPLSNDWYWSSTENPDRYVRAISFDDGSEKSDFRKESYRLRTVSAF